MLLHGKWRSSPFKVFSVSLRDVLFIAAARIQIFIVGSTPYKGGGGGGWVEFLEFSQKERLRFLPQKGGVGNIGGVVLKKWYYLFLC